MRCRHCKAPFECPNCAKLEAERDEYKREVEKYRLQVCHLAVENEKLLREQGKKLFDEIKKQGFKNVDEDDSPISRALRKAGLGGQDEPSDSLKIRPEEPVYDPTKSWQNFTHLFNPETRITYCGIKMTEQADGTWRDGQPSDLSVSPCKACIKARMKSDDEDGSSPFVSQWEGSH